MKRSILFTMLLAIGLYVTSQSNAETLKTFLSDVISFEEVTLDPNRPISKIRQMASVQADTFFVLTKENTAEVLRTAKAYQHCLVFTGSHTIVKVTDLSNCIQSGSWGACMPMGEGYIQRGEMEKKADYINNIIGMPDMQKRVLFLFN
ncbi:hypothetical protein [Carboxylicivirga sp. N1Y90]|uniref:hypothetical protein n=1 Tax=Carboxylicivirga fragile TaxID=3417571 RepID=UPI003D3521DA|nr:hypothetical protein [Marinilabiliaceae bacterium N1Y90]